MADTPDPRPEAYHVLGQLNDQLEESHSELRKLLDQLAREHESLLSQLEEARQAGDEAAEERVRNQIEQVQEAWIVAREELGDDDEDQS